VILADTGLGKCEKEDRLVPDGILGAGFEARLDGNAQTADVDGRDPAAARRRGNG
jgi:hypothetical protein